MSIVVVSCIFVLYGFQGAHTHDYIGCFVDSSRRLLSSYTSKGQDMTNRKCIQTCQRLGFRYAGTEYYFHCFCGDRISDQHRANENTCKTPCRGNNSEKCGGAWRLSVYSTVTETKRSYKLVAFSKGLTKHLSAKKDTTIAFNKVILNTGANINSDDKFICVSPGLYIFHVNGLAARSQVSWLDIYKNNESVGTAYGYTSGYWGSAGTTVVLLLVAGDAVYVRPNEDSTTAVKLYGKTRLLYSTFTGELLDSEIWEKGSPYMPGFTAALDKSLVSSKLNTVVFNRAVSSNIEASGYDSTTGVFTAYEDGTYIFHMHVLSGNNKEVYIELYRNNEYVNCAYGYSPRTTSSAGNSAIISLAKGDTVRVKTVDKYNAKGHGLLFGSPKNIFSSLSGALISLNTSTGNMNMKDQRIPQTAFSVALTSHLNGRKGTTVKYDKIFVNIGSAYDSKTGEFTVETRGIYMFHFHGLSHYRKAIGLSLYRNKTYQVSLYGYDKYSWGSGSNSVALELSSGDRVAVKLQYNSHLFGKPHQVYCTFSGYLVAPK